MHKLPSETRRRLSCYVVDQQKVSTEPALITTDEHEKLAESVREYTVLEKAERLLEIIAEESSHPGDRIHLHELGWYAPRIRAKSDREVVFLLEHLGDSQLVKSVGEKKTVTVQGWERLGRSAVGWNNRRVFVAMSFDKSLDVAYAEGIEPALSDLGLTPVRVDKVHHNDKICDRIVSEIRSSRLLVCDFTLHRRGVYFEAGFGMGLEKPVIWTCREDEISKAHFDTRQYNHITWADAASLRTKLVDRLRATGLAPIP